MKLPTKAQAAELHMTVSDLSRVLYPKEQGFSWDYAVPIDWLREVQARGFDYASNVVWVYDRDHSIGGAPGPLTQEAARQLRDLGELTI